MEPKSLIQKPPKKSRLEARSSCPPFKVIHLFFLTIYQATLITVNSWLISIVILQNYLYICKLRIHIVKSYLNCLEIQVRKEKLGDRIAALQQLVAPFGKVRKMLVLANINSRIFFLALFLFSMHLPLQKLKPIIRVS